MAGGGRYHGYDLTIYPANASDEDYQEPEMFDRRWKVIVCTQVVQYVTDVPGFLEVLLALLEPGGCLVLTWPTNWPEVEREDLHRFTLSGMAALIYEAGFSTLQTTPRAFLEAAGAKFFVGYGALACV